MVVKKRKRALNLRKRTMKVYKGGFRRPNFSFVYPTPDNTKLSIVTMKPNANDVERQMFVTLTLHPSGLSHIQVSDVESQRDPQPIKL